MRREQCPPLVDSNPTSRACPYTRLSIRHIWAPWSLKQLVLTFYLTAK
jgi:hypothetical protein